MNKTDMKKFFPDLYEDLYGPQGSMREIEDIKREIAKEKRQIREELLGIYISLQPLLEPKMEKPMKLRELLLLVI